MHPRHSRDTLTPARPKLTSSMTPSATTGPRPTRAILAESPAGARANRTAGIYLAGPYAGLIQCERKPPIGPRPPPAGGSGGGPVDKDEFKKRLGEFFAEKNVQPIRKLEPDMVMICTRGAEFDPRSEERRVGK